MPPHPRTSTADLRPAGRRIRAQDAGIRTHAGGRQPETAAATAHAQDLRRRTATTGVIVSATVADAAATTETAAVGGRSQSQKAAAAAVMLRATWAPGKRVRKIAKVVSRTACDAARSAVHHGCFGNSLLSLAHPNISILRI